MAIEQAEIRTLIPHAGSMCLLEEVLSWDDSEILCLSKSHLASDNPLRREGKLSALNALEYGAQAAAVHGGLRARTAGTAAPACFLAAITKANLQLPFLDVVSSPLQVRARRLFGDTGNTVYECTISADENTIAEGRVTIIQQRPSSRAKPRDSAAQP